MPNSPKTFLERFEEEFFRPLADKLDELFPKDNQDAPHERKSTTHRSEAYEKRNKTFTNNS